MQKINDYPKDKEDFLFGFNLSPVRKNEKVVFNSYYKNEGEIVRVKEYNGDYFYTVSIFDKNDPNASALVRRGTIFTIEDLSKKYLQMKSAIEKMIEMGYFSKDEFENVLDNRSSSKKKTRK